MRRGWLILAAFATASMAATAPPPVRPSMADSFRLGQGGDTLCQVQRAALDPAAPGLFDRSYAIVCRDAAAPVGHLYALATNKGDPVARLDAHRDPTIHCTPGASVTLPDAGQAAVRTCQTANGLGYDVLVTGRGRMAYIAEGLAGYRSALELGLRTLVADRIVAGQVTISTVAAGDPVSFARAQASSLDPALALAEGYRRNNAGAYAEASEFFDTLLQRTSDGGAARARANTEYLANRALQQSNLGNLDEADALFADLAKLPTSDPVEKRLRRNYVALHLLNERSYADAMQALDAAVDVPDDRRAADGIDLDTALALNGGTPFAERLGLAKSPPLSPAEKAAILDAQALSLRATLLRLQHRPEEAARTYQATLAAMAQVRGGHVTSLARLQAEVLSGQAALAEAAGRRDEAEGLLKGAIAAVAQQYPNSRVLDAANARLAAFLARTGRAVQSAALYHDVVASLSAAGGASGGFSDLLDPYFAVLVAGLPTHPGYADDLFTASQVLLRPGVADTQATLARELSGGSGEAARLFRQSLNEARQASALRVELARLAALENPGADDRAAILADRNQLSDIENEQSQTQARLGKFPAYRAIATQALGLADFRHALHADETYWKLVVVGPSIYGIAITPTAFTAWKLGIGPAALAKAVDTIRASIVTVENGKPVTYPFDAKASRALYLDLAGPAAETLPRAGHLIFEPDGAMQRLPITVLVVSQPGVDRYAARGGDGYDLTGIDWLGGRVDVSVALSPRAFRDVRATPVSTASKAYIGFGSNQPVPPFEQLTAFQPSTAIIDCRWPLGAWNHPIAPTELHEASLAIGGSKVLTGASFSDSEIVHRDDLNDYRIVHFATHGLLTGPKPECPAAPSLMTSFGDAKSDGLLSFGEIFALKLDADLVLLSACDTAGTADVAVTRATGLASGGGNALDGLVRAFIGAGARSVVASHWPAPDDYGATEQLIEGLFTAPAGTPTAVALRDAQRRLMAKPETSHPFYWAGFSLIGDGARPVRRAS